MSERRYANDTIFCRDTYLALRSKIPRIHINVLFIRSKSHFSENSPLLKKISESTNALKCKVKSKNVNS